MYGDILNWEHFACMRAVRNGADVHDYGMARRLREVQRRWPAWVHIGAAQMDCGDGSARLPYFGAILTDVGKVALRLAASKLAGRFVS